MSGWNQAPLARDQILLFPKTPGDRIGQNHSVRLFKEVDLGDEDAVRRGNGDTGLSGFGGRCAGKRGAIIIETRSWI